jgi:hypothetical protein
VDTTLYMGKESPAGLNSARLAVAPVLLLQDRGRCRNGGRTLYGADPHGRKSEPRDPTECLVHWHSEGGQPRRFNGGAGRR